MIESYQVKNRAAQQAKPGWKTMVGMPLGLAVVMAPAVLLAASGAAGGGGFDEVVHGIESRYHAHATRIPFMGLISGIAGIATHGGVHNLHVAEFENFRSDDDTPVDGDEFLSLVEKRAGGGWSRMIRETSRSGDEQTLIFIRPEGKQVGMLVVDLEHRDLNVVEISVNPDQLLKEARERSGHHHHHDADGDTNTSDSIGD